MAYNWQPSADKLFLCFWQMIDVKSCQFSAGKVRLGKREPGKLAQKGFLPHLQITDRAGEPGVLVP